MPDLNALRLRAIRASTVHGFADRDLCNVVAELAEIVRDLEQPAPDFSCAECGTTDAETYVVTTLDRDNPRETRTEVCLTCHHEIRAVDRARGLSTCDTCGDVSNSEPGLMCGRVEDGADPSTACTGTYR